MCSSAAYQVYSKAFDRRFASASTVGYCCSSYLRLSRRFAPARGAVRTGYPTEAPRHVTKSTPAPMGAGGSILKKGGNSHTILLNAAHAVPALLKDQTAAQCRTISATLEKLKEEADRMAALKERGEDQKSGLEGNKARSRTSEDQVQTKWDEVGATSLKRAFSSCDMIDAEWLVQLADRNGILPRNQDIPDQAKVSIEEMERWDDQCLVFGAVVICLPWMNPLHPDPTGAQVQKISFVLRCYAEKARKQPGCRVGVFWSYTALPQPLPDGEDDRDEELCKRFDDSIECLSGLQRYITSGHLLCVGEWTQNIQPNAWIPLPIQTPSVTPAPSPFAFRRDHALQMKSVSTTFAAPLQREAFDEQYDEGKRSGATPGRLRRAETMPLRPV